MKLFEITTLKQCPQYLKISEHMNEWWVNRWWRSNGPKGRKLINISAVRKCATIICGEEKKLTGLEDITWPKFTKMPHRRALLPVVQSRESKIFSTRRKVCRVCFDIATGSLDADFSSLYVIQVLTKDRSWSESSISGLISHSEHNWWWAENAYSSKPLANILFPVLWLCGCRHVSFQQQQKTVLKDLRISNMLLRDSWENRTTKTVSLSLHSAMLEIM